MQLLKQDIGGTPPVFKILLYSERLISSRHREKSCPPLPSLSLSLSFFLFLPLSLSLFLSLAVLASSHALQCPVLGLCHLTPFAPAQFYKAMKITAPTTVLLLPATEKRYFLRRRHRYLADITYPMIPKFMPNQATNYVIMSLSTRSPV
jgi:hypothetical protein